MKEMKLISFITATRQYKNQMNRVVESKKGAEVYQSEERVKRISTA